jgi:hypothetical protein
MELNFTRTSYRMDLTVERMTTHGNAREETIASATEVFPEPELPAMPMMLMSVHGGEYLACPGVPEEILGVEDSIFTVKHI